MKKHRLLIVTLSAAALLLATPVLSQSAADEVADRIRASYETQRSGQFDPQYGSKEGTINFWSSGGLLQETPPDPPAEPPQANSIFPKHINVIVQGDAAVALYYAEGTMTPPGGDPISNYRTRVMEFWIKEDGNWVARAAHYSPLQGGQGTTQVTP